MRHAVCTVYVFVEYNIVYTLYCQNYWHPLLMKGSTILVISKSTNLNVYSRELCSSNFIATVWKEPFSILT